MKLLHAITPRNQWPNIRWIVLPCPHHPSLGDQYDSEDHAACIAQDGEDPHELAYCWCSDCSDPHVTTGRTEQYGMDEYDENEVEETEERCQYCAHNNHPWRTT